MPDDLPSGAYAARLSCGEHEDMIPFFVRPRPGAPGAPVCVLVPTFTHTVYGNYSRKLTNDEYRARARDWGDREHTADDHREYGLSTYNFHRDGSGICYASRLRPVLNLRSGFLSYADARGSGLRHYPADTHLFDWLEATGRRFDVVTDEDLHLEGHELIAPYQVVLTASHPEYHTARTLDALERFLGGGGRLMYLGGNGFYWRVALHDDVPGSVEIRRAEGGVHAWAAEPGEYYNAFDGQYGGLWRRNDRPPQRLVGHGVLRDRAGRGGVLGGLHHVLREPLAQRLRQQRLPHHPHNVLDRFLDPAPFTVGPEPEASGPAQPIDMDHIEPSELPPSPETAVKPERPDPMTLPTAWRDVSTTAHGAVFRALGSPQHARPRHG